MNNKYTHQELLQMLDDKDKTISYLRNQLDGAMVELERLDEYITNANNEYDNLEMKYDELQEEYDQLAEDYNELSMINDVNNYGDE